MTLAVCMGATLACNFGSAPSPLVVIPVHRVLSRTPMANVLDHAPGVNILPFGLCSSLANPAVATATAAAMGVLQPQPCTPVTLAPWLVGSTRTLIGPAPALTQDAKLACACAGVVQIALPNTTNIVLGP